VNPVDTGMAIWLGLSLLVAPTFLLLARGWQQATRRYPQTLDDWPPISILRPIRGASPYLYSNLESSLTADYPAARELLCCVETPDDPAVPVIEALIAAYPDKVRLVVSHGEGSIFGKHANLMAGYTASQYPVVVCSDADVAWQRGNLLELIPPLTDPRVGGSTAVFVQPSATTLPSWLMAAFVGTYGYAPNLAARQVRQLPNAIGGLMAYRKEVLESLGGFASIIRDRISDDGALGNAVWGSGRELYLCRTPFLSMRDEPSVLAVFQNCHRWMLMFRGQGTRAYAQMPLVSPWFPLGCWTLAWLGGLSAMTGSALAGAWGVMVLSEMVWGWLTDQLLLPPGLPGRGYGVYRPVAQALYTASWLAALVIPVTTWGGRRYRVPIGGNAVLLGWVRGKVSEI